MASRVARRGGATHHHAAPLGGVTLNLDWDTGNTSQWTGDGLGSLEAGTNPAHQSVIQSAITRTGSGYAVRQEIHNDPGDINFGFRSLWAKYNSQEGYTALGSDHTDFVYGFSIQISYIPEYVHIWELHHRAPLYSVDANLALAPHAILFRSNQLQYRLMAGKALFNSGHDWANYEVYEDQRLLLDAPLANTWYDFLIRIKTSEAADGITEVYVKKAGDPWPGSPNYQYLGPNMPWIPGGSDTNIPTAIHASDTTGGDGAGAGLYLESGFYTGSNSWDQSQSPIYIYFDQERRYTDLATAKAGWPSL